MAKIQPETELNQIISIIAGYPNGITTSEIAAALPELSPFNLKRRLTKLVNEARIERRGVKKGTRYFPIAPSDEPVHLSTDAEKARSLIRRALTQRAPVGYDRAFLENYRPNVTQYLSNESRKHLHAVGAAPAQIGPAGTYARRIFERLLIDLAWNSSRLEGNTYSLLDTQKLLAHGRAAEGKDARDAQMILNHKQAIEFLIDSAETIAFDRFTLMNLHALLSQNLLANPAAEGALRGIDVAISGSTFMPLALPQRVAECFDQLLVTARAIADPFEQAFFALVHLPYLQPFEDVNKRVSRLAANIPFIRENLAPISFVDVPQKTYIEGLLSIYENKRVELLRDVFIWAYERSAARYAAVRQTLGEPDPFRLKYREGIFTIVSEVVSEAQNVADANRRILAFAVGHIGATDRQRFIEIVETELLNLHEGNIARYRLRPSQLGAWIERTKT